MSGALTLNAEAVVAFLSERGFIDARDVTVGDLRVIEVSGRNTNLRLESGTGRWFFIKQAPAHEGTELLRVEATIYARARDDLRWSAVRPWLPAFQLFDEGRAVLVTHASPAWHDVFDVDAEGNDLDLPEIGDQIGRALAACHSVPLAGDIEAEALLGTRVPWVLRVHRPHPRVLQDVWPAQLEVVRAVQQDSDAGAALDALSRDWQTTSLIHGDLKFNNVLVETAGTAEPGPTAGIPPAARPRAAVSRVVLVDWETASRGDPAWDVASVFQSYLWYGVHLVSVEEGTDAAAAPRAFAAQIPAIRRCLRGFWVAYRQAADLTPQISGPLLGRAAAYTGARLLQTAYESAQGEERPGRLSTGSLQLALNVLRNPPHALEQLLGVGRLAAER
jgi:hypothetical protein